MSEKPASAPAGATSLAPRNKQPPPPVDWVDGPLLTDRAAVRAWLDGLGAGAAVRLPVAVLRSPLSGVKHATVFGGPLTDAMRAVKPDVLALELDDGRLGISLADRLAALCPGSKKPGPAPCHVWLEGIWRARPIGGVVGRASGLIPLAITRVGGAVDVGAGDLLRAYRAGPTPPPAPAGR